MPRKFPRYRTPIDNDRVRYTTTGESLTDASMAPECDINNIMAKYEKTGLLEHTNNYQGQYGDFTDAPGDYHAAMNQVILADEMFQSVPAKIRAKFGNDAGAFLDFVQDPSNSDRLIELGLAKARPSEPLEVIETSRSKKAPEGAKTAPTDAE